MKIKRVDVLCVECKDPKEPPVWKLKHLGMTEETYVCNRCRALDPAPPSPLILPGLGLVTEGEPDA